MSQPAPSVANLTPAELSQLAQARRGRARGGIARRAPCAHEPMSSSQQGLWFLERLNPNTSQFHVPVLVQFDGALDRTALELSLRHLIERHEVLRTRFGEEDGTPFQSVGLPFTPSLAWIDLSVSPASSRNDEWLRLAQAALQQPFDLQAGPLVRTTLFTFEPDRHWLLILLHHIVADGWSAGILAEDLQGLYAHNVGDGAPLPELPLQYADFAVWQRSALRSGQFEDQLNYWKSKLTDLPASPLPTSAPAACRATPRAGMQAFQIPQAISHELLALGQRERATPFMTLLAAFKVLLFRHTGQTDVVVGAPIAGRTRPELEPMIGCFVNPLVLRTDLSGDPQFGELLQRVRDTTLGAYANQDVPFERLVEEMQPDRRSLRSPLFQVAFTLQSLPSMGEISTQAFPELSLDTPKYELFLSMAQTSQGLRGVLEYDRAVFDDEDIRRLIGRFQTLLEAIATRPVRISALMILDPQDIALIAYERGPQAPTLTRVDVAIGVQATESPDRVAVRDEASTLTYGELWARSDALAREIRAAGVRAGDLIAILLDRSSTAVVAMLATLRAGCAYAPIDPQYPAARVARMLHSVNAVITTQGHGQAFDLGGLKQVMLDQPFREHPPLPAQPADADAEAPAYAIFTSGSTGTPKLAMVSHAGLSNLVGWYVREFDICVSDRALIITSLSFDLTQKNIFAPLVVGGEVHLLSAGPFDPLVVANRVRREAATFINCTPSAMYALADLGELRIGDLATLRFVVLGGEPIATRRLLPLTKSRHFQASIANTYGPTECSDVVSCYRLPGFERFLDARVPIGTPIDNVSLHVLDENLAHMPEGMEGELCVSGIAVGLGYRNDPVLSAGCFVPNPHARSSGDLLYRTGDQARRLADGTIDFLGRRDEQLKLRGFRLELGEIESVLLQHDSVKDAAVGLFAVAGEEPRLAAYVVPHSEWGGPILAFQAKENTGGSDPESLYELPNGMLVAHRNRSETEFLYRELFERRTYFQHGIDLPADAVVFDVGANIGLFGLQVLRDHPDASVFAFEPIPPIFGTLSTNASAYGGAMRLFQIGLSATAGTARFYHYSHASILSGRYADDAEERDAVRSYLLTQREEGHAPAMSDGDLQDVLDQRLTGEVYECELKRLSDIIRSEVPTRIDLLKIDVEKSELDVLQGIDDEHWPLIRQVVAEVHDVGSNLTEVVALFESHGFVVTVEQDCDLTTAGMFNVYARRSASADEFPTPSLTMPARQWLGPEVFRRELRKHLAAYLPEPMVPAHIVYLDRLPTTPSGKLDRNALPALAVNALQKRTNYMPPRTEFETELAEIWMGVLGVPRIGVWDDFFDLGGHSLLATQVVARVRREYDIDLPLRKLFENPTIEEFSRAVATAVLARGETDDEQEPPKSYAHGSIDEAKA